jgi:hypothetical protein
MKNTTAPTPDIFDGDLKPQVSYLHTGLALGFQLGASFTGISCVLKTGQTAASRESHLENISQVNLT